MITVECNPRVFAEIGMRFVIDLQVLQMAAVAGETGVRVEETADDLRVAVETVRTIFARLVGWGLVIKPARSNKQGCPQIYTISPAGLALMQRAISVVPAERVAGRLAL